MTCWRNRTSTARRHDRGHAHAGPDATAEDVHEEQGRRRRDGHDGPRGEVDVGLVREPARHRRQREGEQRHVVLPEVGVRHAALLDQPRDVKMLALVRVQVAVRDHDRSEARDAEDHDSADPAPGAPRARSGREGASASH